jgi:hypothetical protein
MPNVIVERPRWAHAARYPRAHLRSRGGDDPPARERMSGYGDKQLNENLAPLRRFLRSRVGKPWAKVHSEIAAQLRVTSAVQKHVLDHLREYVITSTFMHEGAIWGPDRWGRPLPVRLHRTRVTFFVDPRSALLAVVERPRKKPALS